MPIFTVEDVRCYRLEATVNENDFQWSCKEISAPSPEELKEAKNMDSHGVAFP